MSENTMSENEVLQAQINELKAENNKLKAVKADGLSFRVSAKGAVSVYGLGRWPTTLYQSQMTRLMGAKDDILQFIEDNQDGLAQKPEAAPAEETADETPAEEESTEG